MKISFLSLDQEQNKTYFVSEAVKENNTYIFLDNSTENVIIYLTIEDESIYIRRTGEIEMFMHFKEGTTQKSSYKNKLGLEFEFQTQCTKLTVSDKKILIWYDMLMNDGFTSSFKLSLNIMN
ncbi:MAG: DUF1934 domain-containing protein [Anaeroplasmataceae bacterium]|nr:DUF1934 domain-containing protein [Anaeroplasmataceae bacterium]